MAGIAWRVSTKQFDFHEELALSGQRFRMELMS